MPRRLRFSGGCFFKSPPVELVGSRPVGLSDGGGSLKLPTVEPMEFAPVGQADGGLLRLRRGFGVRGGYLRRYLDGRIGRGSPPH